MAGRKADNAAAGAKEAAAMWSFEDIQADIPFQLDYLADDVNGTLVKTWVPNALSLVQAVGGPILVSSKS